LYHYSGGGNDESSRRLKTELLIQLDGLAKGEELVFLLAATNLPWELDPAMLRRYGLHFSPPRYYCASKHGSIDYSQHVCVCGQM
jgi:SpoVK/Ycf46/Vps4 family AAA+-type ATPase